MGNSRFYYDSTEHDKGSIFNVYLHEIDETLINE